MLNNVMFLMATPYKVILLHIDCVTRIDIGFQWVWCHIIQECSISCQKVINVDLIL